jgi:hypothetical protein
MQNGSTQTQMRTVVGEGSVLPFFQNLNFLNLFMWKQKHFWQFFSFTHSYFRSIGAILRQEGPKLNILSEIVKQVKYLISLSTFPPVCSNLKWRNKWKEEKAKQSQHNCSRITNRQTLSRSFFLRNKKNFLMLRKEFWLTRKDD